MNETRLFVRMRPEGRISKVAKIFLGSGPKAPVIECILVDYSPGGACLQLEKFVDVPERFVWGYDPMGGYRFSLS